MQTLLRGRRIRGCERCLVELAEDRLRRQVSASKSARPCSELARFGKAAYTLVREDVIPSPCHFSKEGLMGSERTSRRELLKGGAALAGGVTLGELAWSQAEAQYSLMVAGSKKACRVY